MDGGTCVPLHTHRGQRTACRISFSPSTMKVPGIELKSPSSVASALNGSAILWVLAAYFEYNISENQKQVSAAEMLNGKVRRCCQWLWDTRAAPCWSSQSSFQRPQLRWSWILDLIKESNFRLSQCGAELDFVKRKYFPTDFWGVTRKRGVQRKNKTHIRAKVWPSPERTMPPSWQLPMRFHWVLKHSFSRLLRNVKEIMGWLLRFHRQDCSQ